MLVDGDRKASVRPDTVFEDVVENVGSLGGNPHSDVSEVRIRKA